MAQPQHMRKLGYWAMRGSHIIDVVPFMERLLQKSDPISAYVRAQLEPRTVGEMNKYKSYKGDAERLSAALATELNKLLILPSLYDPDRFRNIKLRGQTRTLLAAQQFSRPTLAQLNRMLLEDAYPRELKRITMEKLPRAWGYDGTFEDKLTGVTFHAVWPTLEEAEMLWQPHEFWAERDSDDSGFVLPYYLRLQLEVCVFVPPRERSNVYRGSYFERDIKFRVRQCIPLPKGPVWKLRMHPAKKAI